NVPDDESFGLLYELRGGIASVEPGRPHAGGSDESLDDGSNVHLAHGRAAQGADRTRVHHRGGRLRGEPRYNLGRRTGRSWGADRAAPAGFRKRRTIP